MNQQVVKNLFNANVSLNISIEKMIHKRFQDNKSKKLFKKYINRKNIKIFLDCSSFFQSNELLLNY